jgi:NAD(P)-dependent dehydrogenase (short-subunit alcohol dehydrogenase family)
MPKLQGKVAVVTGGSSGMGLATAKRFVEEGAFVYIIGRRQSELDKAVSLIGRSVAAVQADVSNLADLDRLYAKVASEKAKIDILFAGAGIVEPQPLAETTEESFDKVFAINTRGLAFTVKKALPLLNDGGAIIVITSIAENKGIPGFTAYSATKAAVRSFVRTWTAELKDRRIRVNAISPGPIDTPIFEQQAPTKEGADQARAQFAAAVLPVSRRTPAYPDQRTFTVLAGMSQTCQKATSQTWSHITGGRRLRRPHFLRRRRVGHPFYVIVRGNDWRRPNVVVCFHYLDCFDTACRKDGPGARKVVSDLALDSSLCRAIGAAGTSDPW